MGRFSADAKNLSTSLAAYCSSSARPRNFCCSAFASYQAKACSHADCALGGDRLAPVAKHAAVTLKANSIPTVAGLQAAPCLFQQFLCRIDHRLRICRIDRTHFFGKFTIDDRSADDELQVCQSPFLCKGYGIAHSLIHGVDHQCG